MIRGEEGDGPDEDDDIDRAVVARLAAQSAARRAAGRLKWHRS